jgi:hypothetical protein
MSYWVSLLVGINVILILCVLALGAARGMTIGQVLRVSWWAVCHPLQRPPDDL